MSSLEQLKKQAKERKLEKEEIKKREASKSLEENQKVYEKNKKVQKSVEKRQGEVEEETEDIKRKRSAISSAFKSIINQIRAEYQDIKKDPSNPLAFLFLEDEEGNITKNLNKRNVLELEEVESKIPELKATKAKKAVLKSQKEKLSKIITKLEDQEKELYPKTKTALQEKYIHKMSFNHFLNELKNPHYEQIFRLPVRNLEILLEKEPENIEIVKELLREEITEEFEYKKKTMPLEYTDYAKDLIQEYVFKDFDRQIYAEKVRAALKASSKDSLRTANIDNLEFYLKKIEDNLVKYKNIVSELKREEEAWGEEKINLDQKISFKESHNYFPINEESLSKKQKYQKEIPEISKEIEQKEEELNLLFKKNPIFRKSTHQDKLDKVKDDLYLLNRKLNQRKIDINKAANELLNNRDTFKVLRKLNDYLIDYFGEDIVVDIRKELLLKEEAGGITLQDYIDRLKESLFQIRDEQSKRTKDLEGLTRVFVEFKEKEKSSNLSEIRSKIIKHFSKN